MGFKFAYLKHMGSIAFGSFIIALVRFIKLVFVYLAQSASSATGENMVTKVIIKCGLCYLEVLEKITDYINASAYAYMAVSGEGFCMSAWHGFLLQIKHLMKFAFANMIARMFIFIGKVGLTVANVFSLIFIMKNITEDSKEVSSVMGPCLVVGLFTYFAASVFLGLFDTAVLSLMTALAIDMDMNGGELQYGPPTFHDSVNKIDSKTQAYDAERRKRSAPANDME